MNRKRTVFLLIPLVLVILAVVISIPYTKKKTDERIILADFDAQEINGIEFNNEEYSWKLVNDGSFVVEGNRKTDETAVNLLLGNLLYFDGKLIAKQADKKIYGLDKPLASVTYTEKNGNKTTFYLGNKTSPGTEYYVSDENGNIYTVYTEIGDAIQSERYEVEDSFILGIDYDNLRKIEVGGELPFDLIRENNNWKMICRDFSKEIPTDIVKQKVTRHFGGMYSLRTIEATEDNRKKYWSEAAGDTVTLYDKDDKIYVINIGVIDNGQTYITVNDDNIIYCVIEDCFEFIKLFREEVY